MKIKCVIEKEENNRKSFSFENFEVWGNLKILGCFIAKNWGNKNRKEKRENKKNTKRMMFFTIKFFQGYKTIVMKIVLCIC